LRSQPRLCGLSGSYFVDSLFNEILVNLIRVKRLVERRIRFAQTAVCVLTFVTGFRGESTDLLALFWTQV
jgi:hypothetical protein